MQLDRQFQILIEVCTDSSNNNPSSSFHQRVAAIFAVDEVNSVEQSGEREGGGGVGLFIGPVR